MPQIAQQATKYCVGHTTCIVDQHRQDGALLLDVVVGHVVGNVAVDQPRAQRSRHCRSDNYAVAAPVMQ